MMTKRAVTQQEWNELEGIRRNALRNGGMAGEMYIDKYLAIASRVPRMPAQHVSTFWHFYQVRKAQRAVDARNSAGRAVDRKQLNEAEAELEAVLVRAGL